ncbi:MAG: phenylacetate--CoA ligase [Spirochaetales bacterium]|nr:phenylacetate--CoA ligase [Spirochaetales bacterium]
MFWVRDIETLLPEKLKELQVSLLDKTVKQAIKSPFYHKKLGEQGLTGISSLEDVNSLPFTEKEDLRSAFPYGFLCTELKEAVRLHSSSGTTGNPTVIFHTRKDIDEWANLIARCMYMTGATESDVFQNMMGYGLFTGGLGFHYGAEKLGMLTIPIGPGNSKRQIWFMKEFNVSVVHILPSYALRLQSLLREMGLDRKRDLPHLRIAYVGAEPHSEAMRKKIEKSLDVKAYNSYGLSEMCGPGVAFECEEQNGLHLWEDSFYMEIIDPETGKVLPEGEEGELVLTTLNREAMPLIRYRTRDLTRIMPGACPCGRTHRRIERIKGRSDDMLIINGVNVFPIQVERVLMGIPGIGTNYVIEVKKDKFMDKLYLKVEVDNKAFKGTLRDMEILEERVTEELKAELSVTPKVKLVESASLPVTEGKAVRVYDLRNT